MSTKHTELVIKRPGEHHPDQISLCIRTGRISGGREVFQAIARIEIDRGIDDKGPSEVEQANARLIAAAPDLLAALSGLADAIGQAGHGKLVADALRSAYLAITRATDL